MLKSFKIHNFALLERASIEFGEGFNVITGETGAGKSILVGALSMVLGEWVGKEIVRQGAEFCEVEVLCSEKIPAEIKNFLKERDLQEEGLVLRRRFYAEGRSRCYINDRHVTLSTLKELGDLIVDIHSQNQHQSILRKNRQMKILDLYAKTSSQVNEVGKLWSELRKLLKEKDEMEEAQKLTAQEMERIQYEIKEINSLPLNESLEDDLEREAAVLSNAEKLREGIEFIINRFYEDEASVTNELSEASQRMDELAEIDEKLKDIAENIQRASIEISEAVDYLRSYAENIDLDTERLELVLEQKQKINVLKRKYGPEIRDILEYKEEISKRLNDFENFDTDIKLLEKQIEAKKKKIEEIAQKISDARKKSARELSLHVNRRLSKLGMEGAEFKVKVEAAETGPAGKDNIEFLIRTNPGGPVMELSKIASGGEVSRIMLALKTSLSHADSIPVLIFDEIDAGIGATVAESVGNELKQLSDFHQVISITHLPQIAAKGDVHIKVEKNTTEKSAKTVINTLSKEDRIKEICRMLGGKKSRISEKQAVEILRDI